ncbi:hypothetical protein JQN72_03135 [Phycicoccus sp. CSK15P-2]|uniref:HD domain-containing protein n=1 Tax=Phycicoccus sp. CSK15P-2 TaxID=2807627 RepID=UPI00194EFFE5|nr:hypothetical protein [Phycicoccus sp. CSK15P-2]MBM6403241.1 hypothetical protein [Phycicoccus sp. CSK15P-2]
MQSLTDRWAADARGALDGVDDAALAAVGRDLVARWDEPHRHYHDSTHLAEVIAAVDELCKALRVRGRERSVALLAAWFHDAVYSPVTGADNERASARYAVECLATLGADDVLVDDVATVVLDTAAHEVDARHAAPARVLLHDADLWVLSAPTPRFDEYCVQVRAEYAHVTTADYAAGRSAVLRPFLVRPHVYATPHARRTWEPAARENLARELSRLAA